MTDILSKPIRDITHADIKSLVTSGVPEGERMEFKRGLPAKGKGNQDQWMSDQTNIGDFAKNKILKEVVAFANAYGGVLVLGIEEDGKAKPAVAKKICPIPKCEDLADRFRLIFRDRVEPNLPACEIFAVQKGSEESGVVVFRVPGRSRLAPHRITKMNICPIRRWDRSEEMTMREIQDMTLNVARGLERLGKKLQERENRFEHEFERICAPERAYGIRITAVPVGDDLRLQRIFQTQNHLVKEIVPPRIAVKRQIPGKPPTPVDGTGDFPRRICGLRWKPRLRAARTHSLYEHLPPINMDLYDYIELHCDGLVEFGLVEVITDVTTRPIFSEPAVWALAYVIYWADALRRCAGIGQVEYAVQIAVHVRCEKVLVLMRGSQNAPDPHHLEHVAGKLETGLTTMPKYALSDVSEAGAILSIFERDLCNAGGKGYSDDVLGKIEVTSEHR